MEVKKLLHMAGGIGESSYASNSKFQEKAILKIRPMLEEAIIEMHKSLLHKKMIVADLGCSSGPNAFLVLTEVMKTIGRQCQQLEVQPPEMQFFLNDLPGNDFNTLFRLLDDFEESMKADKDASSVLHFVAGLPGSFYGRLFPSQSVPEGLDSKTENVPLNRGNIYIGKTSSSHVVKLYQDQFKRDFTLFLKFRFNELVPGGQMVLAFLGRKEKDYNGLLNSVMEAISALLNSMVLEGLVEEEKLDSFNIPLYAPSMEEAEAVINEQGLYEIIHIKMTESNRDNVQSGANLAMCMRSVLEPMIVGHFGAGIVDELFSRFAMNAAERLAKEKTKVHFLAVFSDQIQASSISPFLPANMDSYYSHSSYFYFSSSNDQTIPPPHPTKPIPIPISTPSDQNSASIPVHLPDSRLGAAAIKIQSVYRGHLVRSLIQTIRSVDADAARLERLIQRQETVNAIRDESSRERIRINEMLMKALLRLDSVPGFYREVRQLRRDASRRIVALQEVLDGILVAVVIESDMIPAIPGSLVEIVDRICRGEMEWTEKGGEEGCCGRCVWHV
ncbi:S-adenosyl-L-methionine-dependent methyltransferase superfamily protein [Rhynchospora pubera]|uniref:S-adenosyl-L-methionine-dependent methyltransferase superfamily protein n=1 Tax=Rhynchospora pubera TaxID=906938 RepID=A0AAV8CF98_9POAL|nr:S-adenosyl-L-methionine-dependent methyltransferase superfamily protein [Rhynchospora pubera]